MIMVDKMLLSYVNQMYILESELYSLCQIKSSLENERTVQMNRIQDEKFSYSLPRHSNTNIGEYVKGALVLFWEYWLWEAVMFNQKKWLK